MIGLIVLGLLWGELSAETHSLRYFITGMTPIPNFPEFVIVGYVDGVQFVMYDSNRKDLIPREQWMVDSEGPKAWKRKRFLAQEREDCAKRDILTFMSRTNQTGGIHIYQMMTGCALRDDGTVSGFNLRGWDGQDLISFDKVHRVWVTPIRWAESIKNSIEWLRKYLEYGQRELRVVAPIVSFIRLGDSNWLSCLVTGFYPRAIEVTLWRDGALIDESLSTGILPNHDRTYQIRKWIEFDPEDQAEYSCQVERSGLEEKLVVIYASDERTYSDSSAIS
ncbi:class I histocompatibility antigen, F10 alpha chain-like [Hemiscyllium ocellatum]|uniref:class I histocompatibility antigen, F10 alpha chain-like n=1 Tax=Hemiscyllium ocellatum TaxID=170820 RepID=UPI002967730F|nr:class I histocompatibility antigen, F10 alpha chain-like [Hemiscyllium ocellatum]XP_060707072.1 class I histocompatibility antigen, F10 alpha chain-like [Hemiscyllium ocellatum]